MSHRVRRVFRDTPNGVVEVIYPENWRNDMTKAWEREVNQACVSECQQTTWPVKTIGEELNKFFKELDWSIRGAWDKDYKPSAPPFKLV